MSDEPLTASSRPRPHRVHLARVPEIITLFWVIKVLTTAMGEATSDYLAKRLGPVPAGFLGALALAVALVLQFRAKRYVAWRYWLAVDMVAVVGTMGADGLHVELHVPYWLTTPFFAACLAVIFLLWQRVEGTLDIHSVNTARRELFYWATVMATFALGTAAGDLTAVTLHLGFVASIVLFAVLISIPAVAHWRFRMNEVLAFWFAYVLTRPLGASIADWMGMPRSKGGLGWGPGVVAVLLTVPIVVLVAYLAVAKPDVQPAVAEGA